MSRVWSSSELGEPGRLPAAGEYAAEEQLRLPAVNALRLTA
jgi:hypothetical protein